MRYWLTVAALAFLVVGLTSTLIGGFIFLYVKVPNYPIEGLAVWIPLATGLVVECLNEEINPKGRKMKLDTVNFSLVSATP